MKKSIRFYHEILGLPIIRRISSPDNPEIVFLPDIELSELSEKESSEEPNFFGHIGIAVDNNAISLCYRVRKSDNPIRQVPPEPQVKGWTKAAHVNDLPNGDLIVNPLAMQPGMALINMGYEEVMDECKRRVQAHWHWLQSYATFSEYEFDSNAGMLGIRESYRVVGEYVLTQHDLLAGLEKQAHSDIIAIADHAMDVHGAGGGVGELQGPYGIPFRCLVPKEWENLLVACRGASFSHIAASSCRLSRTMIALGHAAGAAAAIATQDNVPVAKVNISVLQKHLSHIRK